MSQCPKPLVALHPDPSPPFGGEGTLTESALFLLEPSPPTGGRGQDEGGSLQNEIDDRVQKNLKRQCGLILAHGHGFLDQSFSGVFFSFCQERFVYVAVDELFADLQQHRHGER